MMITILSFLMTLTASAECLQTIKVQEVTLRSNPNLTSRIEAEETLGDIKKMQIDCKLYKETKIGDLLMDKDQDVSRIRLFSKDKGVIERKRYKVLEK